MAKNLSVGSVYFSGMTLRSNLYVTEQLSWPLLGYEIIHRFAKRMLSFDSCIIDLDHGHQERQNLRFCFKFNFVAGIEFLKSIHKGSKPAWYESILS